MSWGKKPFVPATKARMGISRPVVKLATCPAAWTPESVRPAPVTFTSSPKSFESACSSVSWTDLPFCCTCQPT